MESKSTSVMEVEGIWTRIPLRITISRLPIVAGIIFTITLIVLFTAFGLQQRFIGYIPTVSESAVGFGNTQFFIIMMTFESLVIIILHTLYLGWGEMNGFFRSWIIVLDQIVAFLSVGCLAGLAACPLSEGRMGHLVTSNGFFLLSYFIFFSTFFSLWRQLKGCTKYSRLVLLACALVLFILMTFSSLIFDSRSKRTGKGVCEILFIFDVILYLLTWKPELKSLNIEFVLRS